MRARLGSFGALAALIAACGGTAHAPIEPAVAASAASVTPGPVASAPAARDDAFRETAPSAGPETPFQPPKILEGRLANGIRLLVVERHELPIVAVQISIDRGADQAPPGVGAFTGAMLLAGTKTKSALQLSDDLTGLGATYGAHVDFDSATVEGQVLTPNVDGLLETLSDVLRNPAFDKKELERERSKRLTALQQENDSPKEILGKAVARVVYPKDHPYASTLLGDEKGLKQIGAPDLRRFHAKFFQPDHTTVALAGDISLDDAAAKVGKVFGGWKGASKPAPSPGDPPAPDDKAARLVLIDRPGASQSNMAVALPGVPRSSKDFDAILVMNAILGGQFSSRLNLNLREKHAYTYGAGSFFDFRHGPGPFRAGGAMVRESTEAAGREILKEVERMRTDLVTDEELADAKANLIKQLPARFETAGATAGTLAALSVYGLPLDEFATRPERLRKITTEDVKRVAEAYLRPERLRLVVVGDAAKVKEGLAKLGGDYHLGLAVEEPPASKDPPAAKDPKKTATDPKGSAP
jgi:zinc protease